ncbi:MAG TPA: hypothetical protein VGN20_26990 [Mucilaginibacter sp.]|jgi:cell division septum initiation protein DivIVA
MKRTVITFFIGFTLLGCADKKAQEKALLDDVIKVHDKVMMADEQVMKNKMQLDTLIQHADARVKDSAAYYSKLLNTADDAMSNWMHKFNPAQTGKSHDEIMTYFDTQKKQVMAIDSQLTAAVTGSTKYLLKTKSK